MDVKIAPDWKELLAPEFEKPYFADLTQFVRQEYATRRIYPRGSNIFRAFDKCPFDKLKVVIIGQDPYHGEGQANGLCFSVADGVPFPPSLQNIFQEVVQSEAILTSMAGIELGCYIFRVPRPFFVDLGRQPSILRGVVSF